MIETVKKNYKFALRGNPTFVLYLSRDVEDVLAELACVAMECAFPLDMDQLSVLAPAMARAAGYDGATCGRSWQQVRAMRAPRRRKPTATATATSSVMARMPIHSALLHIERAVRAPARTPIPCPATPIPCPAPPSARARQRFKRTYEEKLGLFKTSHMDIKRAEKATDAVQEAMFKQFTALLDRLEKEGRLSKDERSNLAPHLFNMDEMGSGGDAAAKRTKKLARKGRKKPSRQGGSWRLTIVTDGDKKAFHASVAVCIRATGEYHTMQGVIHSSSSQAKNPRFSSKHVAGLEPVADKGWLVAVTKNGSMELRVFEAWCHMFVKSLPAGFGPGGKVVILLLDGHASRWTYRGLAHLIENNVSRAPRPPHACRAPAAPCSPCARRGTGGCVHGQGSRRPGLRCPPRACAAPHAHAPRPCPRPTPRARPTYQQTDRLTVPPPDAGAAVLLGQPHECAGAGMRSGPERQHEGVARQECQAVEGTQPVLRLPAGGLQRVPGVGLQAVHGGG